MKAKDWLALGAGAVAYLLGAFGGFLKASAPPAHPLHDSNSTFAVGVSSFAMLFVYLLVAALMRTRSVVRSRTSSGANGRSLGWIAFSVVCFALFGASSWQYNVMLDRLQFEYPPNSGTQYTAGSNLTPDAQKVVARQPSLTKTMLVEGFGGLPRVTSVWTESSIDSAYQSLACLYVFLVVTLGSSLFALAQGVLAPDT